MATKPATPATPAPNRGITLTRYPTRQQRFNLYMPVDLVEGIKAVAARQGVSYSEVIKRTMADFLARQQK